jgi:hypothetical protein
MTLVNLNLLWLVTAIISAVYIIEGGGYMEPNSGFKKI